MLVFFLVVILVVAAFKSGYNIAKEKYNKTVFKDFKEEKKPNTITIEKEEFDRLKTIELFKKNEEMLKELNYKKEFSEVKIGYEELNDPTKRAVVKAYFENLFKNQSN